MTELIVQTASYHNTSREHTELLQMFVEFLGTLSLLNSIQL